MASKFLIFVIDDFSGAPKSSGSASEAEMAAIDEFNDQLRADGQWIFAGGLSAPAQGEVIDNRNGVEISIGNALFDSHENYSGFWLIEAEDHATARNLALEGSKACNRKVELRPLLG